MNARAFTLIELLMVIAVISIIAALLFPVFGRVREKGRQTACESNERQLGIAIMAYAQDHDETLPPRTPAGQHYSWKFAISPYLKSQDVYHCPSNPSRELEDYNTATALQGDGVPDYMSSYAVNRGSGSDGPFIDPHPGRGEPLSVGLNDIVSPAQTIGIVESTSIFTDFVVTNLRWANPNPTPATTNGNLFAGHTGMSNFLFMDGHIKAMKPLATLDSADGGSGTVNMWTNAGKPFVAAIPPPTVGDATGKTVLSYSERRYR